MPLRAIVDGSDKIGPLLGDEEWEQLRVGVRSRTVTVVLPCCGRRGLLRVSKLGLKHFYHAPDSGGVECAGSRGETMEHLMAKAAIAGACMRAGYAPVTEWAEGDWRADVLAVRGSVRLAFEVQWSRQTLAETLERQVRYARSGVRGCWLFRNAPPEMRLGFYYDSLELIARGDIPAFTLTPAEVTEETLDRGAGARFTVHLREQQRSAASQSLPLGDFVETLLTRRIGFRERAVACAEQPAEVRLFLIRCPACKKYGHTYAMSDRFTTPCGRVVHKWLAETPEGEFHLEVARAVRAYCDTHTTDQGWPYRLGEVGSRRQDGHNYLLTHCYWCGIAFPKLARLTRNLWNGADPIVTMSVPIHFKEPPSEYQPHWCYVPGGCLCAAE